MSRDYFKVSPKDLLDLTTNGIPAVVKQLDQGRPVLIDPNSWESYIKNQNEPAKQENPEEEECQCPACKAKRATIAQFADKYPTQLLEEFFVSGNLPKEVGEYFDAQIEDELTEVIDSLIGECFDSIDKDRLIHISELTDLPNIPRYETKPVVIAYHTTRKIPKDYLLISKAPALIKSLDSNIPDYMILGNLDKEVATNLKNSTESYRFNQSLIAKVGNRAMGSSTSSSSVGIADLLKYFLES